ncbi:uncharacterized protein PHACADRAFT_204654 [Phanerochaete carnosa HHB-10118-sp]|uniref:Uncharacterized protein n=1 Tax=Phanerochaete carnosa (strain HHB-10118-sp) TaxID=650164 RepID=K5XEI7_PHACS|nr:uncharacterized protein PHACADRAFT_204654 [Phanerochaete carnosa HHB-10118-sp]EKM61482.1 hypothetical protein PHACADRAFT_204654 [Phanerochaete carnosa HHB-10118-sp]
MAPHTTDAVETAEKIVQTTKPPSVDSDAVASATTQVMETPAEAIPVAAAVDSVAEETTPATPGVACQTESVVDVDEDSSIHDDTADELEIDVETLLTEAGMQPRGAVSPPSAVKSSGPKRPIATGSKPK